VLYPFRKKNFPFIFRYGGEKFTAINVVNPLRKSDFSFIKPVIYVHHNVSFTQHVETTGQYLVPIGGKAFF
jgi:hypothetical protein